MLPNFMIAFKMTLTGFFVYRIQRFFRIHRTWELCILFLGSAFAVAIGSNYSTYMAWLPDTVLILLLLLALEPEVSGFASKVVDHFNPNSLNKKNSAIYEIAQAANALGATKTGALIAFERRDSLLKFGGTGIEINADIKKELVTTLFTKDSPTHDGGVLIRGGRATHCGAVFPLTDRKQMENGLGTRHRAALGLTEKTDAVCLVVSEEVGTVSLAKNGELIYGIAPNELEMKMRKLIMHREGVRYYPLHYLKRYGTKLTKPNFAVFSKSITEKLYEASVTLFWFTMIFLFNAHHLFDDLTAPKFLSAFLNTPWVYAPIFLFAFNFFILISNQRLVIDGGQKQVKKENRFLFIPLPGRTWTLDHLRAVVVKRESSTRNLAALGLYTKKQKIIVLDRSTASKALLDQAKKIRDVLRLELIA